MSISKELISQLYNTLNENDVEQLNNLIINNKIDINEVYIGRNILSLSILQSKSNISKKILQLGFNPDIYREDFNAANPWRTVCWKQDLITLKEMLKTGKMKYINYVDESGFTPIVYAFFKNIKKQKNFQLDKNKFISYILNETENVFNLNSLYIENRNIYQELTRNKDFKFNHNELLPLFIKQGLNINHQDNSGNTLMHYFAYQNKIELIKILIKSGGDIFINNKDNISVVNAIKDIKEKDRILMYYSEFEKNIINSSLEIKDYSLKNPRKRI